MDPSLQYMAVGHVTIDVLPDGRRQAGGSALYAALQAARLGWRARVITQGRPQELERLLAPFAGELELEIRPAARTTTLRTFGRGSARRQHMVAWAGPIAGERLANGSIVHLAPVARELGGGWRTRHRLLGLTPQGLVRRWSEPEGELSLVVAGFEEIELARRCDALVLSELERESCAALTLAARRAGAILALTAGSRPTRILSPAGEQELEVRAVRVRDDLGAGDVFAAAFFVALMEGREPLEAGAFASAAAAVRMQGVGAGAIGDRATVEARL